MPLISQRKSTQRQANQMTSSRILKELWRDVRRDFQSFATAADEEDRLPNVSELTAIKDALQDLIDVFGVMNNRLASNNDRMILPTKAERGFVPTRHNVQIAPTHRLIQNAKSSTTIADAISAAEKNGSTKSDDSGSIKSEKKRKFTEQEDSYIWDVYAAYTSNKNHLEDPGFSVPDGVVLELAQKLNTNTQKLQARLRDLKSAHFQKKLQEARQQQWMQDAAKKVDDGHKRDNGGVKQHSHRHVSQRERKDSETPAAAPVTPPLPSPRQLRHGEYSAEEDTQLWSAYEKNFFQFLDSDQLHSLGVSLERSAHSLDKRLRQLIEAQSGVPAEEVQTVEFTPAEDAIIRDTFARQVNALPPNNSEHDRDLLQMQVAEDVAAQLNKFYGRVWYRLQWLKEHPVDKPAAAPPVPTVPPAFPTSTQRAAPTPSAVVAGAVRSGGASQPAYTKDTTGLVGNKNRRDFAPSAAVTPSPSVRSGQPSHSAVAAGKAGVGGAAHGKGAAADDDEPESGEVSSDVDDGTGSTYSTRSEGSDYKTKARSKNTADQQRQATTTKVPASAVNTRPTAGDHHSQDSEPDSSMDERTARRTSRAKALRSGRYTEEEDMEIWIAFTSAEGQAPAKLGKVLAKAAKQMNRSYSSVAGRLERLMAQQKDADEQYQPGQAKDAGADADTLDTVDEEAVAAQQVVLSDGTAHSEDESLATATKNSYRDVTAVKQAGTVLEAADGDGGPLVKKQRVRAREFF